MTNTNQQEQLYGVGSFNHRFKAKKQGIDEWVTGSLIERTLRYGFRYSILVLGDVEDNIEDEEIIIDYPTLQPVKTFETPVEDGKLGGEMSVEDVLADIISIRNKLYEDLPTGEMNAFELLQTIKWHINELDNYCTTLSTYKSQPSTPVQDGKDKK